MAKIINRKKGRTDGGYTRVFNNSELGALLSQVQATVIANGTELEKIITFKYQNLMTDKMFTQFIQGNLLNGIYLINKATIKNIIKCAIGSKNEPDFIVININDKKAYIVEVKDGDTFDTKKSAGEIATYREFAQLFAQYLIKSQLPYSVEIKLCSFNQTTKEAIVTGLKGEITKSEAWTGKDFCKILGISFDTIVAQRTSDAIDNLEYFVDELLKIDDIKNLIISKSKNITSQYKLAPKQLSIL